MLEQKKQQLYRCLSGTRVKVLLFLQKKDYRNSA